MPSSPVRFAGPARLGLALALTAPIGQAAGLPSINAHSQVDDGVDMTTVLGFLQQAGVSRAMLAERESELQFRLSIAHRL